MARHARAVRVDQVVSGGIRQAFVVRYLPIAGPGLIDALHIVMRFDAD